ncbi:MAG: cytidylate kinase-like family protein [Deltaproteobacteria bacterium]|nr:cytidylate kinase-like family protein [Deltaproteobacteria bacterium]
MAIITISRGSYSKGKEVAEKAAERLGYQCLSRDVILEASGLYHIPEIKLVKAIHDAPSVLERLSGGRSAYIAYYKSALTRLVKKDNIVYHGLAGHLLLKGVPHVIKVRIIADLSDRVRHEMTQEGVSEEEARSMILKDDQERRKWTMSLYGADPWDSALYDFVIHIQRFTVSNAVDFVCDAARLDQFKTTAESQQKMDDLALASQVKAALVTISVEVAVTSDYGNVLVFTGPEGRLVRKLREKIKTLSKEIQGINNIEVHPGAVVPPDAI